MTNESSKECVAIDVHGHYGTYRRHGDGSLIDRFCTGDADEVVRRARGARIGLTFVSPLTALLPRFSGDAVAGNREAAEMVPPRSELRQYAVIDPRSPETYDQAATLLEQPHCVGIKIHPEEHGYPIVEYAEAIFQFAAARRAVVLTHSSERNSRAMDFVPWADRFPEVTLIVAHIGCGWDGDPSHQVRAIQQSRAGNIYADTSSASSITPRLIEWAVSEVGVDHVLFGTDTPLYHASMQRARIDAADLSDAQKRQILRGNAIRVFKLDLD
jgi:predicted TIM-barrel fold metal-dependent hydrolase